MAPYIASIETANLTTNGVAYIGDSRLAGDSYVSSSDNNIAAQSSSVGASLPKGEGYGGLFTATFFGLPGCTNNLLARTPMSTACDGRMSVLVCRVPRQSPSYKKEWL